MPLLFCLAVHNALGEVQAELLPGERLVASLDDVYVLCSPERCRKIYNLLADKLQTRAGIRLHREDENVEPSRRKATRHGGYGSRGVEPRRFEGVGDTGGHMVSP